MTIHIGLIGCGNISGTHAGAARNIPGVKIAAAYSPNSQKARRLCSEHGCEPYSDFESFLRHRPMHLVIIGSPSGFHASQGIAAADRGLHVLTEKPIDITTQQADRLIAATERAGAKLGVMFQDRVKPGLRQLRQWISEGLLGRVLLVNARVKWYRPPEYYADSRWRGTLALDGGGAVINQAIHTLDLILWLLGDVVRVQARKTTALHAIEAEDTAVALFEFAGGALGLFEATTAAYPGYARLVEISGSEGTAVVEHDRVVSLDLRKGRQDIDLSTSSDGNQSASSAAVSDTRGHQALIEDFVDAIQKNRPPICDGREGRRSLALVEAIYRAADQLRPQLLVNP